MSNEYCEKHCKGYRDTGGRCFADGRCDAYWECQKQKGTMNENNRKRDAMVNDILCDFDFERVRAIMVLMGVKWYGPKDGGETPSVDKIIAVSRELLTEVYDKHKADPEYNGRGTYQMFAEAFNDGQLELTFRPFSASSFESSYNEDGSHNENY